MPRCSSCRPGRGAPFRPGRRENRHGLPRQRSPVAALDLRPVPLARRRDRRVLALLDGTMLTKRRTACASGLASRYLSRIDSARLLMIGTGALAPHLIRVHSKVRPIREVAIWGRRPEEAQRLAHELSSSLPTTLGRAVTVRAVADRQQAVRVADIVSCATLSKAPLVEGAWLSEGQHIDLVGAYTPEMRESDDDAVRRAQVHVDTRAGATREAGDIVLPIQSGAITADNIVADLFELARGERSGRPVGRSQHHALQVGGRRSRGSCSRRTRGRALGCTSPTRSRAALSPRMSQGGLRFTARSIVNVTVVRRAQSV